MPAPTTGPYGTPLIDTFSVDANPLPAPYVKYDAAHFAIAATAGFAASAGLGTGSAVRPDVLGLVQESWVILPATAFAAGGADRISLLLCVAGQGTAQRRAYQVSLLYTGSATNNFIGRIDDGVYTYLRNFNGPGLTPGGAAAIVRRGDKLEFWTHAGGTGGWVREDAFFENVHKTGSIGFVSDYNDSGSRIDAFGGGSVPPPRRAKLRSAGAFSARSLEHRRAGVFVEGEVQPVGRFYLPRPFAASSPFNQLIDPAPAIHPNSAAMRDAAILGAPFRLLTNKDFGVSYAFARNSDPLNTFAVFQTANGDTFTGFGIDYDPGPFRVPADAAPAGGTDKHLSVHHAGREMSLWVAVRQTATTWKTGVRYVYDTVNGSGIAPADKFGPVAANFAASAGTIRPEDITRGVIDHALCFTVVSPANFFVAPATHGDGSNTAANAIPIGARIQLDPAINVDALAIPQWQKVIARCLQTYGAFCRDTGGNFALMAESSTGRGFDMWAAAGVPENNPQINAPFPWSSMRVLAF